MADQIDYDLQRKLIEINRRYEQGELTYREWIDERMKVGATDLPSWSTKKKENE